MSKVLSRFRWPWQKKSVEASALPPSLLTHSSYVPLRIPPRTATFSPPERESYSAPSPIFDDPQVVDVMDVVDLAIDIAQAVEIIADNSSQYDNTPSCDSSPSYDSVSSYDSGSSYDSSSSCDDGS